MWNTQLTTDEQKEVIDLLLPFVTPARQKRLNEVLNQRTRYMTVALEDIYQPHNAAAVIRSCDCFGVQDIHIIENQYKFDPSSGVSLGSQKWVDHHYYEETDFNTGTCMDSLKSKGYAIVATSPHVDSFTPETLPIDRPVALFFGSEKPGLTDFALENADYKMQIPMYGFTESFNISVSAAIVMSVLANRIRHELSPEIWQLTEKEKTLKMLEWVVKSTSKGEELYRNTVKKYLREREG
jgi:tRNA (guanosine-2'-O-)-methyltransferase